MKKVLPIVIILALVLGIGAWWFLSRGKASVSVPGGIEKKAGEEGEAFTGKIKQAIALAVPMKCSYQQDGFTGTGFVKGKKYYGEITREGKKAYIIMKDNCMWSWGMQENQGVKMCFEDDIWEQEEGQVPTEAEYHCVPTVFSDSKFNPPANIDFMDMDQDWGR